MDVAEEIIDLMRERDSDLNRADLARINVMLLDVEDDDAFMTIQDAIAQIVNDPAYEGDIEPVE